MKLPRKLLNLAYQICLNEMERCKDRPAGYIEDLQSLELILSKEVDKLKEFKYLRSRQ